ncbi:MAG: UPF0262 family protein [Myxococcota bacterium]
MGLERVEIDAPGLEGASEARRLEWDAIVREMTTPGEMTVREGADALRVVVTQQALHVALEGPTGRLAEVEVPQKRLGVLVNEYVDVVRQIASPDGQGVARLEALDMAKKVTHDKAGRFLQATLAGFGLDHPSARRLFTLLMALKVDTTRLVGVHGHRRVR